MTGIFEELAQAELARDAAEQFAGLEIDSARRGRRHAVGVAIDLGNVVAGILGRIARDRIVIENGEHFCHGRAPSWAGMEAGLRSTGRETGPAATCRCRAGRVGHGTRHRPYPRVISAGALRRGRVADVRNSTTISGGNQVGASERSIDTIYRPTWTKTDVAEMLLRNFR